MKNLEFRAYGLMRPMTQTKSTTFALIAEEEMRARGCYIYLKLYFVEVTDYCDHYLLLRVRKFDNGFLENGMRAMRSNSYLKGTSK